MISKKGGLVFTVAAVLTFLISVINISSCTRPLDENPYACNGVVCKNGGGCDSGRCKCPVGYEGSDCSIVSVNKYFGYWNVHATIIGSDSTKDIGDDSAFTVYLHSSSTKTTFFIDNFYGNQLYNNMVCILDSIHNYDFGIDTTSPLNMYYDHYRFRGGWGSLYGSDSISGLVFIKHLNSTVNWQVDTVRLSFKRL